MKKIIKIKYDSESKKVYILYEEKLIDVSIIDGKDISVWAYPFIIKNKRWDGIYEEMRKLCQFEEFIIVFWGSNEDLDVLKNALKDTKVELMSLNNKVVILYNDEKQSTKITINGKAFDTSRINNFPIEKWIFEFESGDIKWKGIFAEMVKYIGINSYSIQFIGKEKDMKILMDNCPENVDITFRLPAVKQNSNKTSKIIKKMNDSVNVKREESTVSVINKTNENMHKTNIPEFNSDKAKGFFQEVKSEYEDLKLSNSMLSLTGKILCAVSLFGCVVSVILMSRFFVFISLLPAIIFAVLAFKDGYKKVAITVIVLDILLGIIGWAAIYIRLQIMLRGMANDFEDMADDMNKMNDELKDLFGN